MIHSFPTPPPALTTTTSQSTTLWVPKAHTQEDVVELMSQFDSDPQVRAAPGNTTSSGWNLFQVKFTSSKSMKKLHAAPTKFTATPGGTAGLTHTLAAHEAEFVSADSMAHVVDMYMAKFDEDQAAAEAEAERMAGEPDEDGFILVSKKQARKLEDTSGSAKNLARKQKRGSLEKSNFYRFQTRASKEAELAKLRMRFEADKSRVKRARASSDRKFTPHS